MLGLARNDEAPKCGPAACAARRPPSSMSEDIGDFFNRNDFHHDTRKSCDDYAITKYPHAFVTPAEHQGYCSYTVNIGSSRIVQFRPSAFRIDEKIASAAKLVLAEFVPETELLGTITCQSRDGTAGDVLYIYLMERMRGTTLAETQGLPTWNSNEIFERKRSLVLDLARTFAMTYTSGLREKMLDIEHPKGKVGSSLRWRLDMLRNLPSQDLKNTVREAHDALNRVEGLPWCMTHGDMVPANITVDPETGQLLGLIDWAEGEYLPFGLGLYGLEEVLGVTNHSTGLFEYHGFHGQLRREFWTRFRELVGQSCLRLDEADRQRMLVARKLGILLWRGIAFEDGRIDRVVEEGVDDAELHKLRLFLAVDDAIPTSFPDVGEVREEPQTSKRVGFIQNARFWIMSYVSSVLGYVRRKLSRIRGFGSVGETESVSQSLIGKP